MLDVGQFGMDHYRMDHYRVSSEVDADGIRELLRLGQVQFVVADGGQPLQWIPVADCFRFWKEEVKPHLAAGDMWRLEMFPGEYCYTSSRSESDGTSIIVLTKHH